MRDVAGNLTARPRKTGVPPASDPAALDALLGDARTGDKVDDLQTTKALMEPSGT